jgi:hypothetical protein
MDDDVHWKVRVSKVLFQRYCQPGYEQIDNTVQAVVAENQRQTVEKWVGGIGRVTVPSTERAISSL